MQGVLFALYAWNVGPLCRNKIDLSVVDIGRDVPFPMELSPEISREGTSKVQQALYHFEAEVTILFRQRKLFNTLVSERRLRHIYLHNKGKITRGFYTGELVVVRKQVKSIRKDGVSQK